MFLHRFSSLEPHGERLRAGCTGRGGGVSKAPYDELNVGLHVGDDPTAVLENRRRVARAVGVELESFVIPQQVHRAEVRVVTAADLGRGALSSEDAVPGADVLITREAGIALAVILADCVPVIVFDPRTPAIGVAHAGWAGTVGHVARNTVHAMQREFGGEPGTFLAAIGPSIGPHSYEVGADVAEHVRAEFPAADVVCSRGAEGAGKRGEQRREEQRHGEETHEDPKYLLDLWGANVADLTSAGVRRECIEVAGLDTFQMPERFFSHRRMQPTGRFLAFACLLGQT